MRSWNGYDDLRGMQELAVEHRRLAGARAPWHIGGLTWSFRMHANREHEWTVRIWEDDGRVVAWSRLADGALDFDIHPAHRHLYAEVLDEPNATRAFGTDDDVDVLARHGFAAP